MPEVLGNRLYAELQFSLSLKDYMTTFIPCTTPTFTCTNTYIFKHTNSCRAIKHLLDVLKPYMIENGGPLKVEHVEYVENRGNLIIEYTPEGAKGK